MSRRIIAALSVATLFAAPASISAQDATGRDDAALFYRAYFVDRGLERKQEALKLYLEFLAAEPNHRMAGHAARFAMQLLDKADRKDEAAALAKKHAAVLSETVPAGINANFLDPDADVSRFVSRFEAESREVSKHRSKLLELVGLKKGQAIADIGAGTGLFTNLFAREVGSEGRVYAVDIGPTMVAHLRKLKKTMNLPQVEVVHCTDRSAKLAPQSIDVAFICDTYHHFEHPAETMKSIHSALRPGGQLIVIDFHRIPGKSREWLLNHVRAGQEVFASEIERAGFRKVREEKADYLEENYVLRFEKRDKSL